jgi:hypothetical protein
MGSSSEGLVVGGLLYERLNVAWANGSIPHYRLSTRP